MAATGNVQITGTISNLPTGAETFGPFTTVANTAVALVQTVSVSTNTTVTLPTAGTVTTLMIVGPNGVNPAPNPSYGGTLTLKGSSGDTGLGFSAKYPLVMQYDANNPSPASVIVNASVATTVTIWTM